MNAETVLNSLTQTEQAELAAALPDELILKEARHRGLFAIEQTLVSHDASGGEKTPTRVPLDAPFEELDISARALNRLKIVGTKTVAQLICATGNEILSIPGCGENSLIDIEDRLAANGYKLTTAHERSAKLASFRDHIKRPGKQFSEAPSVTLEEAFGLPFYYLEGFDLYTPLNEQGLFTLQDFFALRESVLKINDFSEYQMKWFSQKIKLIYPAIKLKLAN